MLMNYYRHIDRATVQFDFLLTEPSKSLFEDEILSLGGRVFRVSPLRIRNPFPYIRDVRRFFRDHPEYQIVHSHTSSKSFLPLYLARNAGIPVRIAHSHNNRFKLGLKGRIQVALQDPLKKVATHLLACSEDAARWLYGRGFNSLRLRPMSAT